MSSQLPTGPSDGDVAADRYRALEAEVAAARADVAYLAALERVGKHLRGEFDRSTMLQTVLDDLLDLFGCDRAWLLYPCDPTAPTWGVPMERARPAFPGVFTLGVDIPMDPGAAAIFSEALASPDPLPFDPTTERQVPADIARAFSVRAQLALAVRPRRDKPWLLGLHHCATDHVWNAEELRLFAGLGARIAEALDALLLLRELHAAEQRVARLQRMDAIGSLAGGVAHDFNNQLQVILCFADMIAATPAIPSGTAEYARRIIDASESAAELTGHLLAFSRRTVLEPVVVDLGALIRDQEPFLRRVLGSTITLALRIADAKLRARVDPNQIEQVTINLINNARDALPHGGSVDVTVDVRQLAADDTARPPELDPGAYVVISVADDGDGMPEEVRARIFEPFFTTKKRGEGTGLGLSTAYGVARQSGGSMTVTSAPGQGACFTLLLPQSDAPVARETSRPHSVIRHGTGESILVVDDRPEVALAAATVLEANAYSVQIAAGSMEALELLAAPGASVDLLLTDVMMRDIDGVELAERALALRPGLKITFATGYTHHTVERLRSVGMVTRLLQKPYRSAELLEHVRLVLDAEAGPSDGA